MVVLFCILVFIVIFSIVGLALRKMINKKYHSASDYIDITFISLMIFLFSIQMTMFLGYNEITTKETIQSNIEYLFVTENNYYSNWDKAKSLVITDLKTKESNVYDIFSKYEVITEKIPTSKFITTEIITESYMPKWYENLFWKKKIDSETNYKYKLIRSE